MAMFLSMLSILASPGAGGVSGGGGGGAVINSEEFLKFQSDQQKFAAQHVELYMRYLARDSRAGELAFDQEKATSLALQAKLDSINREHGDAYIEGIQPHFDNLKARHFDSSWNWARQDALLMYYGDIIFGRLLVPLSIEKSPRVALPSLTGLTLTCFNSCSTISVSVMLQREKPTD